jgi:hypothetical protein
LIDRKQAILDRLTPDAIASFVRGMLPDLQSVGRDQALVRCLYHEEQTASLSIQLSTGLHNCKACKATGDLFKLVQIVHGVDFKGSLDILERFSGAPPAATLAPKQKKSVQQRTVATFTYHTPDGAELFYKERREPSRDGKKSKEFIYYRLVDGKRVYNLQGVTAWPYRVHALQSAETIYFPEGEAKADLLVSWGLCGSCLQGGASDWEPRFNQFVTGKHVVVMPDNDPTGEKYAATIAAAVKDVAASVRVLRLPGLQAKGDVLDWVKLPGNDRQLFLELAAAAEPWLAPPSVEVVQARKQQSATRTRAKRGADVLIPMLAEYPLFKDDTGSGYIMIDGKLHLLDAKNTRLFEELFLIYWRHHEQALSKEAGNAAIAFYSGMSRLQGVEIELFKRVGLHGGKIFYNLMNDRAVEVSPGSWRIVSPPPVMFTAQSHHLPQPDPLRGGDPWRVFEFIRVQEDQRLLFLVTLITCLVPGINHPALAISGPQGSGKSTTQAVIKLIIDPASILLSMMPRKIEEAPLLLSRNYMTALDNQSYFPAELADLLCAAITGGVLEKRKLHTDDEMMAIRVPGVITYSAITAVSDRPDLQERIVRFMLERLRPEDNISEDRLYKKVAEAVPAILGGMFDLLARAMELQPTAEDMIERLPRMADFAIWGYAIAEAMGGRGAEFLAAYSGNTSMAVHDLLAHNTFFSAIVQALERPLAPPLQGTFAELIRELQKVADPDGEQNGFKSLSRDSSFPKSHQKFRDKLERLKVPLNALGIGYTIEEQPTNRGRVLCRFFRIEPTAALQAVNQLSGVVFDDLEVAF